LQLNNGCTQGLIDKLVVKKRGSWLSVYSTHHYLNLLLRNNGFVFPTQGSSINPPSLSQFPLPQSTRPPLSHPLTFEYVYSYGPAPLPSLFTLLGVTSVPPHTGCNRGARIKSPYTRCVRRPSRHGSSVPCRRTARNAPPPSDFRGNTLRVLVEFPRVPRLRVDVSILAAVMIEKGNTRDLCRFKIWTKQRVFYENFV
jgi:hypothetical protein